MAMLFKTEPEQRLRVTEILEHPFMRSLAVVPISLSITTLACQPSLAYISQFQQPKALDSEPAADTSQRQYFQPPML